MKRFLTPLILRPVLVAAALFASAAAVQAQGFAVGTFHGTADKFELANNTAKYLHVHMVSDTGDKIDADEMHGDLQQTGGFTTVTATGNVRVYTVDQVTKRTYTLSADKAIYNRAENRIDLSGHVKTIIESKMTQGPLVQTGDTGYVLLGPAPDYPQIGMSNVHMNFTPQQPPAPAPKAKKAN